MNGIHLFLDFLASGAPILHLLQVGFQRRAARNQKRDQHKWKNSSWVNFHISVERSKSAAERIEVGWSGLLGRVFISGFGVDACIKALQQSIQLPFCLHAQRSPSLDLDVCGFTRHGLDAPDGVETVEEQLFVELRVKHRASYGQYWHILSA